LPYYFKIENVLLLRIVHSPITNQFRIDKELHLNIKHHPHANFLSEHYCRRWISISLLQDLEVLKSSGITNGPIAGVQRSQFINTKDTYLNITIAKPSYPQPDKNISITLSILLDKSVSRKIEFADDIKIIRKEVNTTCERCPALNCAERVAPPTVIDAKLRRKKVDSIISRLIEEG
jgi:hypothetical protein